MDEFWGHIVTYEKVIVIEKLLLRNCLKHLPYITIML